MSGIKGTGFPGVLNTGGTGFIDMGAIQSGASGSGIKHTGFPGVLNTGGTGYLSMGALQVLGSSPQTISPAAAIPTGESWGTPDVAGPIKLAAAIPTGEHWGSPTLSQFQQITLNQLPAIFSGEAWGTPDLAGPITMGAAIPTGEHWPTPLLNVQQVVTPAAPIPTGETWYPPFVSTLAISPPKPAIPSGETWYSPHVGAQQFINVASGSAAIPSSESWPIPAIQGGNGAYQVFLGGINLTGIKSGSSFAGASPMGAGSNAVASTIVSQAIGRATLTLDYVDIGGLLVPGQFTAAQDMCGVTIKVVEAGLTLFAGCIDTVGVDREMPFDPAMPTAITYHITALDKTSICDHRVVTGVVYAAGSDPVADVLDVVANYLNGEGITTQGVAAPGTFGVLGAATSGQYETVTQMLNELATQAGAVWWIDVYGVLWFQPLTSLPPAPWGLDETASNAPFRKSQGTPMVQNSVSGGSQTSGYRNQEFVVSNLNVLPGSGTGGSGGSGGGVNQSFDFAEGQPGIWDDPPGTPFGIETLLPIGSVLSLTVNGNVQTVYELSAYSGQTSTGPNDFLWSYLAGGTQLGPAYGPIPTNADIEIQYVPGDGTNAASVVVGSASNPLTPFGPKFGHCGSGIVAVIDQVQNVATVDNLDGLAAAFLNKSGNIPQILTFETDKPGLFVGQGITVYLPSLGIPRTGTTPSTFFISEINGTAQQWYLKYNSFYRWTVTAINNYDPSNWMQYMANLIQQTTNPLPVLQYETCTLVSGTGSTLSAGIGITNPYSVQRTGLFVDIRIAAATVPIAQNLVVTLLRNGVTIATAVLYPSSTPNVFLVTPSPAGNQLYLFANDVLTWNVSYQPVGGGTPVKASGVTVVARWSM
jgi:hypothetical protein